MSDKYTDLLTISRPEFSGALKRLMKDVNETREVSSRISLDPFGTISSYFPETLGKVNMQKVSEANKLVYAVLANDGFRSWAQEYNRSLAAKLDLTNPASVDKSAIRKDLAEAILKHGDTNLVYALLGGQTRLGGLTAEDMQARVDAVVSVEVAVVAIAVVAVHVVVTVIDFTPKVPDPNIDLMVAESSGSEVRAIAEQLMNAAKRFKDAAPE